MVEPANVIVPVAAPTFRAVAAPAKLIVVAVVFSSATVVSSVEIVALLIAKVALLIVAVPVAAPIFRVVAAPAKFTVVAVVLTNANVVDGVISGDVTLIPAANGTDEVVVCEPSFSTQVVSPVAISDHAVAASVLEIVVPVTGVGAKVVLVKVKVPLEKGIRYLPAAVAAPTTPMRSSSVATAERSAAGSLSSAA